ncbi:MAG: energy transducer TonB, partial [Myxococcota bacterium]
QRATQQQGPLLLPRALVDQPPKLLQATPTRYPPAAERQNIEGFVILRFVVNTQGRVEQLKVLQASPVGVFEQAAQRAVAQWYFQPARYQKKAVRMWMNQKITFRLRKP